MGRRGGRRGRSGGSVGGCGGAGSRSLWMRGRGRRSTEKRGELDYSMRMEGGVLTSCEFHNHSAWSPLLLSLLLLFLPNSPPPPPPPTPLSTSSLPILSTFSSRERSTASCGVITHAVAAAGSEDMEWLCEWLREREVGLGGERGMAVGTECTLRCKVRRLGVGLVARPWGLRWCRSSPGDPGVRKRKEPAPQGSSSSSSQPLSHE